MTLSKDGKEQERKQVTEWASTLDKYLGSVTDYSNFKGEKFEEIELAGQHYGEGRNWKWVNVERNHDWDLLTRLMDQGECVGFVHYFPLQEIGQYGNVSLRCGGYGIPIKKTNKT